MGFSLVHPSSTTCPKIKFKHLNYEKTEHFRICLKEKYISM